MTNLSIYNKYLTSLKYKQYGITEKETHITKDVDYGALLYLGDSKYGNDEYYTNAYNRDTTGCGSNNGDITKTTSECVNGFGTTDVYKQSTTSNITGVFDVTGSTWESVLVNIDNNITSLNIDSKYYNNYINVESGKNFYEKDNIDGGYFGNAFTFVSDGGTPHGNFYYRGSTIHRYNIYGEALFLENISDYGFRVVVK